MWILKAGGQEFFGEFHIVAFVEVEVDDNLGHQVDVGGQDHVLVLLDLFAKLKQIHDQIFLFIISDFDPLIVQLTVLDENNENYSVTLHKAHPMLLAHIL